MMNTKTLEPVLRDATIKAIDNVAKKLGEAERAAESKVGRLLTYWNDMEKEDKEQAVGIAIATITTAVTAIVAMKRKRSPIKAVVKAVVKKKMR